MSMATVPVPMALDYASISRASSEHDVLMDPWNEAEEHYRYPVTRRHLSDAEKFYSLAEAWRQDVRFTSSHPNDPPSDIPEDHWDGRCSSSLPSS